jgi:hypothetical protein
MLTGKGDIRILHTWRPGAFLFLVFHNALPEKLVRQLTAMGMPSPMAGAEPAHSRVIQTFLAA